MRYLKIYICFAKEGSKYGKKFYLVLDESCDVFLSQESILPGELSWSKMEKSMHECDMALFIVTESSSTSEAQIYEYNFLRAYNKPLIPYIKEDIKKPIDNLLGLTVNQYSEFSDLNIDEKIREFIGVLESGAYSTIIKSAQALPEGDEVKRHDI